MTLHGLEQRRAGSFQALYKRLDFGIGLSGNACEVDGVDLMSGPTDSAKAQAYGFGEQSLLDTQVDRGARCAGYRLDFWKSQDFVGHVETALGFVEHGPH